MIDHVINQSQNMREDLIKLYPKLDSRSSVIYNPISAYIDEYINKNNLTKIKKKIISYVWVVLNQLKLYIMQ